MLRDGIGFSKVIICCSRVDLRRGIDGLASFVQLNYGIDTLEKGTLFLFRGVKRDRCRGLMWEGLSAGFCYPNIFRGWLIRTGDFKRIH